MAAVSGRHPGLLVAGLLGLLAWLLAPIVLLILLVNAGASAHLPPARPVLIAPQPAGDSLSRPISLGLSWGPEATLLAPGWDGIIQELLLAPGDRVEDGTPVIRVGGILRVAAHTPWPFSGRLAAGERGEGVRQLQGFLNARGALLAETAILDSPTLAALRAWAASIGVPRAQELTSFDPGWVIYLPEPAKILSIEGTVGAPSPSAGTPIARLAPELLDAILLDPETSEPPGEGVPAPTEPSAGARPGETLSYADTALELSPDSRRVAEGALPVLAALLPEPSPRAAGLLTRSGSEELWSVPAPAVIPGPDSRACIFLAGEGQPRAVQARVIMSRGGQIILDAALSASDKLVIFPTGEAHSCPSS